MPQHRYLLTENKIPTRWYNIAADLPTPMPPPLAPDGSPLQPEMMAAIFPMELILQEVSQDRWITIPDPVREIYALWRPTPLHRAVGFEQQDLAQFGVQTGLAGRQGNRAGVGLARFGQAVERGEGAGQ